MVDSKWNPGGFNNVTFNENDWFIGILRMNYWLPNNPWEDCIFSDEFTIKNKPFMSVNIPVPWMTWGCLMTGSLFHGLL